MFPRCHTNAHWTGGNDCHMDIENHRNDSDKDDGRMDNDRRRSGNADGRHKNDDHDHRNEIYDDGRHYDKNRRRKENGSRRKSELSHSDPIWTISSSSYGHILTLVPRILLSTKIGTNY